ncbi:DNA polymerase III subunit beta [Halobacillus litoralis]|uniref:DNA polymerase III subunit beta n=1 Tax=Halobacillus litoralis TaxID=45668 RepID=UPI001CFD47EE|nr:DNA polymerase III subunit beta [Halobacillus litoralis]WLR47398.1 DNA polymerase III subunit beta [Halobacillus litoralis]
MELRIHKGRLKDAVSEAASVLSKKTVLPVLNGIKLEVREKEFVLVGSDGELMIKKVIPVQEVGCESINKGSCVLPAAFLQDLVKKLPGPVHMKKDAGRMLLESGEVKTSLSTLSTEEYPDMAEVESTEDISMNGEDLVELVRQTLFAAAKEGSRPVLTGVHLDFSHHHVQASATDSHRLAFVKKKLSSEKSYSCTVPVRTLKEVIKVFKNTKGSLRLSITDQLFKVESNETMITSKLLDGAYPNVGDLVTESAKTVLTLDKDRMLESVDRAGLFAENCRNHQVKLCLMEGKQLNISSFLPQVGTIEENIPLKEVTGEGKMDVHIDGIFLLEALKVTKGEDVKLFYNGMMSPLIIRSLRNEEQVHVISPVRA